MPGAVYFRWPGVVGGGEVIEQDRGNRSVLGDIKDELDARIEVIPEGGSVPREVWGRVVGVVPHLDVVPADGSGGAEPCNGDTIGHHRRHTTEVLVVPEHLPRIGAGPDVGAFNLEFDQRTERATVRTNREAGEHEDAGLRDFDTIDAG